jgi:threonine/homoserine/homoserine lactone efflux protein
MSWNVWTLFAVTEAALCLSPGPAVLLVLSQGLAARWPAG